MNEDSKTTLAKIALPVAIVGLVGIIIATFMYDKLAVVPEEGSLAYAIAAVFGLLFTIVPMVIFIPLGLGLLVCEVCLFVVRKNFATLVTAFVFMWILLPVVAFTLLFASILAQYSAAYAAIVAVCAILYIAALVLTVISFVQTQKLRKASRPQN